MGYPAHYWENNKIVHFHIKTIDDLLVPGKVIFESRQYQPKYSKIFGYDEERSRQLAKEFMCDFFKMVMWDCIKNFTQFCSPAKKFHFWIYGREKETNYDPVFKGTKPYIEFDFDHDYYKKFWNQEYEFKMNHMYFKAMCDNARKGLRYLTKKIEFK